MHSKFLKGIPPKKAKPSVAFASEDEGAKNIEHKHALLLGIVRHCVAGRDEETPHPDVLLVTSHRPMSGCAFDAWSFQRQSELHVPSLYTAFHSNGPKTRKKHPLNNEILKCLADLKRLSKAKPPVKTKLESHAATKSALRISKSLESIALAELTFTQKKLRAESVKYDARIRELTNENRELRASNEKLRTEILNLQKKHALHNVATLKRD